MEFISTYSIELLCKIMSNWSSKTLLSFLPRWQIWSNSTITENQKVGLIEVSEINMVMKRLGLEEEYPFGGSKDLVGLDEIEGLFEEEPSFGEIKEAFDVFDQNRDGFIDALELHRVLSKLGLLNGESHSKDVEICMKILGGFSHKGGVDFNNFVRLLEACLMC